MRDKRAAHFRRPHVEEHRSATRAQVLPKPTRCDASRSMRAHAAARPHPSRRAHAPSRLRNAFGMRAPQDEDEQRVLHSSPCQTALLVPAAHICARALHLCFAHPQSRGGRSAERRACEAPVLRAMTRHARRLRPASAGASAGNQTRHSLGDGGRGALRPMTRDARLSALHRGGFRLPGPRFSHRTPACAEASAGIRIGHSELLAARS
jgi:hypothetical protein